MNAVLEARSCTCTRLASHSSASCSPRLRGVVAVPPRHNRSALRRFTSPRAATEDKVRTEQQADAGKSELEETTEKFGLEAGLWKVFSGQSTADGKSKGEQAKALLARYGSAYLITSISFAIVSFAICYALVSSGVDVAALLSKVGLSVTDTSEKVGTFAIAYAAHKALSPVRFPPTVALTPVVAKMLGKEPAPAADEAANK